MMVVQQCSDGGSSRSSSHTVCLAAYQAVQWATLLLLRPSWRNWELSASAQRQVNVWWETA